MKHGRWLGREESEEPEGPEKSSQRGGSRTPEKDYDEKQGDGTREEWRRRHRHRRHSHRVKKEDGS